MRLLKQDSAERISFAEDLPKDETLRYAILSHTWGPDSDEVSFQDVVSGTVDGKRGYDKISFCIRQTEKDELQYFWVDTCCIDKSNNTELSEAINSMFRWYANAEKCYVYLPDVSRAKIESSGQTFRDQWEHDFRQSRWFRRGWTLQELLAPKSVEFFSREGEWLGSKNSLETQISDITGIPVRALRGTPLAAFTFKERFSWQESRDTKKEEDRYYSLLGIMDVSMSVIYGEGAEKARRRLEKEVSDATKGLRARDFSVTFGLSDVVEVNHFVARRDELEEMRRTLASDGSRRCVVLHGMGGIGKTQLSIAYAVRYQHNYSAVFWLSIKDDDSVKSSFVKVAKQILRDHPSADQLGSVDLKGDLDAVVEAVKAWLSLPGNTRWLLIFDNYDRPKLPGASDPEATDIRTFLPEAYQGCIVITTRSSEVSLGHRLPVRKLASIEDGLAILASSSQRPGLMRDSDAERLAHKLDGLPLALATAGCYLHQTPAITCAKYLQYYETSWARLHKKSPMLMSYEDRTLYSTWQISFDSIEKRSTLAANLLRLWAYFGNQDIWFELLCHAKTLDSSVWLQELVEDELEFDSTIRILCNHGLVEKETGSETGAESRGYTVHSCLHSWIQTVLNPAWDRELMKFALCCIASHVPETSSQQWWMTGRRLLGHAGTCTRMLKNGPIMDEYDSWAFHGVGSLYHDQGKLDEAEQLYERALRGKEKALGPEHITTLNTFNNLGVLYDDQGKVDKAELMYERALRGKEKALGLEHISTLKTVHNLGVLYAEQGKLDKAEQMYERALRGCEKALGPEHTSTLETVNSLGNLYASQGKRGEAEQMYERALQGTEKALGPEHTSTLDTVNNLGILYQDQGKLNEAEQMYERALQGYEKALGPEHTSTLDIIYNLGSLYADQSKLDKGKLDKAEQMYERALRGYEKALGSKHTSTLNTVHSLGVLYKLDKAEQIATKYAVDDCANASN